MTLQDNRQTKYANHWTVQPSKADTAARGPGSVGHFWQLLGVLTQRVQRCTFCTAAQVCGLYMQADSRSFLAMRRPF